MDSENSPTIASDQQEQTPTKSRRFPLIIIPFILLFTLLLGGTYLISNKYHLPGEKRLSNSPSFSTPTPTFAPSSVGVLPEWHAPKNYLVADTNGNIVSGSFQDKKDTVIAKSKGKVLGAPVFQTLSKSGKYFLYIQLPDATIAEFQKNPPYEFYGSSDYILHLVTLGEKGEVKDVVVDANVSSLLGSGVFAFDKDEKGLYYTKYVDEKDKTYYYSIETSSTKESPLPGYLKTGATPSPRSTQYVLAEAHPRDLSDTGINDTYNLNLYASDGTKKKTLYSNFISGENSLSFPTETTAFLAREDYVDGPNSICYIDQFSLPAGERVPLYAQECPPGSSNTNFHDLSLSPDGKLLVAAYSQDNPGEQVQLGNFFVYDLHGSASRSIGEIDRWYGKYFWINNREIIVTVAFRGSPEEEMQTYRINLTSGKATLDEALKGKTVLGVY